MSTIARRRRHSGLVRACAALGVALWPLVGSLAAATAVTVAKPEACDLAATLTEAKLPRQARDLLREIDDGSTSSCVTKQLEAAQAKITAAQEDARTANRIALTDVEGARAAAKEALDADAENELAAEVSDRLPRATWTERLKDRWDAFLSSYLSPLQDGLVPALLAIAVMLVVARAIAAVPFRLLRTDGVARRRLWLGGLFLATGSAVLFTLVVPGEEGGNLLASDLTLWALGLSVLAIALLAMAMATRLRLTVEVRGKDGKVDETASGHVIALLGELGADAPRGLEVPRGVDTTGLSGMPIAGIPAGKVLGALTSIWELILGSTPWHVRVDVDSDHLLSVSITRNGRARGAGVVDRTALELWAPRTKSSTAAARGDSSTTDAAGDGLPDLHRFAAAMVLVELSTAYDGFEDLFDVTDWRSIGLHDIGTTHYSESADDETAKAVLARAVARDPRNLPAVVALRVRQDRKAGTGGLEAHAAFLSQTLERLPSWTIRGKATRRVPPTTALRARVLLALLVTQLNRVPARPSIAQTGVDEISGADAHEISQAEVDRGVELIDILRSMERDHEMRAFGRRMRSSAGATFRMVLKKRGMSEDHQETDSEPLNRARKLAKQWTEAPVLLDPRAHYNYACLVIGGRSDGPQDQASTNRDTEEALEHLNLAAADPDLRERMAQDPWLAPLRDLDRFAEVTGTGPRSSLLEVPPFVTHADALKAVGVTTPEAVIATGSWALAEHLKVHRLVADRLVSSAKLAAAIPEQIDPLRLEVLATLSGMGIDSLEELAARPDRAGLVKRVYDDGVRTVRSGAWREDPSLRVNLTRWLEHAEPARGTGAGPLVSPTQPASSPGSWWSWIWW